VRRGETGFVVSDIQDAIGRSIGTALANREHADKIEHKSRQVTENQFSWTDIACRTEEVYASVL